MILIVCVDDNMGMAFTHRRQSQARLLRRLLLGRVGASKLWMSPYTARQFDALPENVQVSETFLCEAEAGEYCFAELSCPDDAEGVVLYRWNRSLVEERERMAAALRELPSCITVFPSAANFLFVEFQNSSAVCQYLRKQDITVKPYGRFLRIGILLPATNAALLAALRKGNL